MLFTLAYTHYTSVKFYRNTAKRTIDIMYKKGSVKEDLRPF